MKSQQQQIWSLAVGLVALALVVAVTANPVTSDSNQNERNLFSSADSKQTVPRYRWAFQQPSDELLSSLRDRILLVRPMPRYPFTSSAQPQAQAQSAPVKRMQCISGLPGGDCENSFLGGESLGQDFLRPGGRNPGRR